MAAVSSSSVGDGAAGGVQLLINPRMRSAYKHCREHLSADLLKSHEFQQLASVFRAAKLAASAAAAAAPASAPAAADGTPVAAAPAAPQSTLTFSQLQLLSRCYRSTLPCAAAATSADAADSSAAAAAAKSAAAARAAAFAADDSSPGDGYLHQLIVGSQVCALTPARSSRQQDPAFKRYLQEQRWKQDRREYAELVKDLPGNRVRDPETAIGKGYASASRDVGHGINILTLMVTGFIVFYYAGTNLFPHNQIFAVLTGLVGLVGAMMVEVCLFLVREQKTEMGEAQQVKLAREQKKKELQWQREQQKKTREELQRRATVLEKQGREEGNADETKMD